MGKSDVIYDVVTANLTQILNSSVAGEGESSRSGLMEFSDWYANIHGYVSILVCVFGIIANFMNIVVLTQKNMVSPTNYLLTALAIADMLTMTSYVPFALYFNCLSTQDPEENHALGWVIYMLFHTCFTITSHTIAMYLTVALAVFRYIVVCHHTHGPRMCNMQRTRLTIILVIIITIIFCIPNYIMYIPAKYSTAGGYWIERTSLVTDFQRNFYYWLFGVALKVAPCVLLSVLSTLLIRAMRTAAAKRRKLKSSGRHDDSERNSEHNRTTVMLVAIVICFVITELPQGVLAFLSGINMRIFEEVYTPLGDVFDILVLVNSSVNFLLYCIMSKQFRGTFCRVFCSWHSRDKQLNGVYSCASTKTTGTQL